MQESSSSVPAFQEALSEKKRRRRRRSGIHRPNRDGRKDSTIGIPISLRSLSPICFNAVMSTYISGNSSTKIIGLCISKAHHSVQTDVPHATFTFLHLEHKSSQQISLASLKNNISIAYNFYPKYDRKICIDIPPEDKSSQQISLVFFFFIFLKIFNFFWFWFLKYVKKVNYLFSTEMNVILSQTEWLQQASNGERFLNL